MLTNSERSGEGDAADQWVEEMLTRSAGGRKTTGSGVKILRGILTRLERLEHAAGRDGLRADIDRLRREFQRFANATPAAASTNGKIASRRALLRRVSRQAHSMQLIPLDHLAMVLHAIDDCLRLMATNDPAEHRRQCRVFRQAKSALLRRAYDRIDADADGPLGERTSAQRSAKNRTPDPQPKPEETAP